jgi:hypothetical protein
LLTIRIYTSWFAENIGSPYFPIKRDPSGGLVLDVWYKTDGPLPTIYAGDIGKWALVAFKNPDKWIGLSSFSTFFVSHPVLIRLVD